MSNDVDVSLGLLNEANSLDAMERLRGQECFWASIESKIAVTSHSPSVVAPSLDRALAL